jgi:hypothetical protein
MTVFTSDGKVITTNSLEYIKETYGYQTYAFLQAYFNNQNRQDIASSKINENIYLENPNQSGREKDFKSTTNSIYNSVGKKVLSTVLDETSKAQSSSLKQNSNLSSYKGPYDTEQKQASSSCRL